MPLPDLAAMNVSKVLSRTEIAREKILDEWPSIAHWAREKGFSPRLVTMILAGQRRAIRGQSRRIAKALGL